MAHAVAYWVDELSTRLRIPTSLAAIGLDAASAAALGAKAEANPTGWTNPIRFTAREYERIYRKALAGHERGRFYDWSAREPTPVAAVPASRPMPAAQPQAISARAKL